MILHGVKMTYLYLATIANVFYMTGKAGDGKGTS